MNAWGYSWFSHHLQALELVLRRFKSNRLNTLLICLAIGVTLALPSILYAVLDSVSGLANHVKTESQISVFLTTQHSEDSIANIKAALEKNEAIKNFEFVSKQDALAKLQAADSNNEVLNSLEENPLPDAFFVEPSQLDAVSIASLQAELRQLEGVGDVVVDGAWLKRLSYLILLGKQAMLIVTSLLAFALVAVIGNTIRMQILTQQAEIELSRLIGATKNFIRRPFLYAGALYGLFGGLFALLITFAVIFLFNRSIAPIAAEYESNFLLNIPNISTCVSICLLSFLVGLLSAYFAVSKSLYHATK
jgi:cell division transport system permease protein